MLMLGKCPLGSPDPSKGRDGDVDVDGTLFQEITDYMNGTDAESDDLYFTGVSRNYVEFMITKEGKIEKTKPGSTTIYYVVKDNEDGSGFYN
jgi:hypothetical protein